MNYQQILDFWFGNPTETDYGKPRKFWFTKSTETDQKIAKLFTDTYKAAAEGTLNHWQEQPSSCLALIIILDQFPRNIYRGKPQAFATDRQALAVAKYALKREYDRNLLPVQRWFIYLPLEHSEDLVHQERCVELFSSLEHHSDSSGAIAFAQRHLKIIQRFGRFPHRNEILGRSSTTEEREFLQQPGSGF